MGQIGFKRSFQVAGKYITPLVVATVISVYSTYKTSSTIATIVGIASSTFFAHGLIAAVSGAFFYSLIAKRQSEINCNRALQIITLCGLTLGIYSALTLTIDFNSISLILSSSA